MSCCKIGTKNGISKYEIKIELGYDMSGKRKRIRRYFYGNKKQAMLFHAELTEKYYHTAEKQVITNITFEEYSNIFIEKYCKPNISKITTKDYEIMLKTILEYIGDLKLRKISTFILDNMYMQIKKGKKGKELSPKTMSHYYNLVNIMFKQARKWKFVDNNPNEDATKPKLIKKKRNFYNEKQVIDLLNCLMKENIKYRTIIVLALTTGIRRSELCAIRWPDINFRKKTLYIDNSLKVIEAGVIDEEKAKTQYSVRLINLNDETIKVLKEYKSWQDDYILSMGDKWQGEDRVFTSKYGGHINPSTCTTILRKIVRKYDLSKITFHELRHTFATILNGKGVDVKTISELLGHADTSTTLNIYTHTLDKNKKESVNVFCDIQKNVLNS